jgi:hypothetical protein
MTLRIKQIEKDTKKKEKENWFRVIGCVVCLHLFDKIHLWGKQPLKRGAKLK